jgi:hypothetical protein
MGKIVKNHKLQTSYGKVAARLKPKPVGIAVHFVGPPRWHHLLDRDELYAILAFKDYIEQEQLESDCIWPEEIPHSTSTTAAIASESESLFHQGTTRKCGGRRANDGYCSAMWMGYQYALRVCRSRAAAAEARKQERDACKKKFDAQFESMDVDGTGMVLVPRWQLG